MVIRIDSGSGFCHRSGDFCLAKHLCRDGLVVGPSFEGSLALVILVAVAVGILIGVLVMAPGRIKSSLSNARNRKKIGSLEASLDEQKPN